MSLFCVKKLKAPTRLGLRLKEARQQQGLELATLAAETHISVKYLLALEESSFENLPVARGYRSAYLRAYADALGLNAESCLHQFYQESELDDDNFKHPLAGLKNSQLFSVTNFLQKALIIAFIIAFTGYLTWQIRGILEPPKLTIYSPQEGVVSGGLSTLVQGETEKECQLTINGQNIMINEQGRFEGYLSLSPGVNTITISAIKKHGKTTTIVRHVIAKENNTNEPLSLKNN